MPCNIILKSSNAITGDRMSRISALIPVATESGDPDSARAGSTAVCCLEIDCNDGHGRTCFLRIRSSSVAFRPLTTHRAPMHVNRSIAEPLRDNPDWAARWGDPPQR